MTPLTPEHRSLLRAALNGEFGDIDLRYDGGAEVPQLDELVELGLLTSSRDDPGRTPYLLGYFITPLGVRVATEEDATGT